MELKRALRVKKPVRLAFTGSGGKTTALFRLARELPPPVIITATTHLGVEQLGKADRHLILEHPRQLEGWEDELAQGVSAVTGARQPDGRTSGMEGERLEALREAAEKLGASLLIEADGSRQLPLKAPAEHEPPIPVWIEVVVVVAGLSGIGRPVDGGHVHRAEIFSELTGLAPGEAVTWEALRRELADPRGGMKNIPSGARRVVLLNQADNAELRGGAHDLAKRLIPPYHAALVGAVGMHGAGLSSEGRPVYEVIEPAAGIVLAAGGSVRLGQPKQLLAWQGEPLVRRAARTALESGLSPVIVVTGAYGEQVAQALEHLPVTIIHNPAWEAGQSTSVRAGLGALPEEIGSAMFFLSDQPFVTAELVGKILAAHHRSLAPLVAPRVAGRRANPVLFDRDAFAELGTLSGDAGGRSLFERYPAVWVEWDDPSLLEDIDTPEDVRRLTGEAG